MNSEIEAYKFKSSYYIDDLHMYGHTVCEVYCVENYFLGANEPHFYIKIDRNKLITNTCASLPVNKKRADTSVYDIGKVMISSDWVASCYEYHKLTIEIGNQSKTLVESRPIALTEFDMFDELLDNGIKNFRETNYTEALRLFNECVEKYSQNPNSHRAAYNIACCHSKFNNFEETMKYLNVAFKMGYNNWSHMIMDYDVNQYKNREEFINLVKAMMEKDPEMHYGSKDVHSYLDVHGLEQKYVRLLRIHRNGMY